MGVDHWKSWLNKVQQMKFQVLLCLVPSTMSAAIKQALPSNYYPGYPPLAPQHPFYNPYFHPSVYPLNPNLNNPYPSIYQPTTSKLSLPHPSTHHPYFSDPSLHHRSFPLSFLPPYLPLLSPDDGGYVHDPTGDASLPYVHSAVGDIAIPYLHDQKGDGEKSAEKSLRYKHDPEGDGEKPEEAALPYQYDKQGNYKKEEQDNTETTTFGST